MVGAGSLAVGSLGSVVGLAAGLAVGSAVGLAVGSVVGSVGGPAVGFRFKELGSVSVPVVLLAASSHSQ